MTLVMLVNMTMHTEFVGPGYGDWVICNNHHDHLYIIFMLSVFVGGYVSACYQ